MWSKWTSNQRIVAIVVAMILFFFFLALLPGSSQDPNNLFLDRLSAALLFGTLIALLWYTEETHLLRVASYQQLELSVKPFLAITSHDGGKVVEVVNVGNGTAINIEMEPTWLSEEFGIKIEYPRILSLRPGERETIVVKNFSGGTPTDFPFGAHLDPKYSNRNIFLIAHFDDVMHQHHTQELLLGKGGPKILTRDTPNHKTPQPTEADR